MLLASATVALPIARNAMRSMPYTAVHLPSTDLKPTTVPNVTMLLARSPSAEALSVLFAGATKALSFTRKEASATKPLPTAHNEVLSMLFATVRRPISNLKLATLPNVTLVQACSPSTTAVSMRLAAVTEA